MIKVIADFFKKKWVKILLFVILWWAAVSSDYKLLKLFAFLIVPLVLFKLTPSYSDLGKSIRNGLAVGIVSFSFYLIFDSGSNGSEFNFGGFLAILISIALFTIVTLSSILYYSNKTKEINGYTLGFAWGLILATIDMVNSLPLSYDIFWKSSLIFKVIFFPVYIVRMILGESPNAGYVSPVEMLIFSPVIGALFGYFLIDRLKIHRLCGV